MAAGDYNTPAIVRIPTTAGHAGATDVTTTYRDGGVVWVALHPLSGREQIAAGQVQGIQQHRLRLRYDASLGLTIRHRLKLHGTARELEINSLVDINNAHKEWEILATEAVQ